MAGTDGGMVFLTWASGCVDAVKGGRAAKQPASGARLICPVWDGVHVTGEKPGVSQSGRKGFRRDRRMEGRR